MSEPKRNTSHQIIEIVFEPGEVKDIVGTFFDKDVDPHRFPTLSELALDFRGMVQTTGVFNVKLELLRKDGGPWGNRSERASYPLDNFEIARMSQDPEEYLRTIVSYYGHLAFEDGEAPPEDEDLISIRLGFYYFE